MTVPWLSVLLAAFATWRVTHLLAYEDGPWDLVIASTRRETPMSCCGQTRAELRSNGRQMESRTVMTPAPSGPRSDPPRVPVGPPPQPPRSSSGSLAVVTLRYLARAPIMVQGAVTQRAYRFSGAQPLQQVARGDVEHLLASGFFRRGG